MSEGKFKIGDKVRHRITVGPTEQLILCEVTGARELVSEGWLYWLEVKEDVGIYNIGHVFGRKPERYLLRADDDPSHIPDIVDGKKLNIVEVEANEVMNKVGFTIKFLYVVEEEVQIILPVPDYVETDQDKKGMAHKYINKNLESLKAQAQEVRREYNQYKSEIRDEFSS